MPPHFIPISFLTFRLVRREKLRDGEVTACDRTQGMYVHNSQHRYIHITHSQPCLKHTLVWTGEQSDKSKSSFLPPPPPRPATPGQTLQARPRHSRVPPSAPRTPRHAEPMNGMLPSAISVQSPRLFPVRYSKLGPPGDSQGPPPPPTPPPQPAYADASR